MTKMAIRWGTSYIVGTFELLLITCLLVGFHCSSINVCGPGLYGGNCSNVCPSECKDGLCRSSGLCEDCRDGLYGIPCDKSCPSTCPDNLCHRFNVSCKKECSEGMYGKKCDTKCPWCPGPCHWSSGECIGNSSGKPELSQTHTTTDQTTHSALTTDARRYIAVARPRCREEKCWIEFNGWPVCHYECADGTRGTACAETSPRNYTQYERQVTSGISNGEDCNAICFGFTVRCFNESNVDESVMIQHVEACSENCTIYCRNLSAHDTGPCDQLSTACADECVHDYIGALCERICDQGKESEADTTPPRGGLPNIIIIIIITIIIVIVITASCILLTVRCWSVKTQNRPSASYPSLPAARDVDDVVNMTDDREGDAGDGLREMEDMGASLPLSASYLSAVHHANRDTEGRVYAVPDNHWKISAKHQPPPNTSYISPVHSAVYSEVEDGRTRPMDHRQLFGDYQPRFVNENQTCDQSARGVGYSNPYGARNSTGNARVPPQEHYESLNRFQHIDPNRLYSFLEIADEETNVSTDTS